VLQHVTGAIGSSSAGVLEAASACYVTAHFATSNQNDMGTCCCRRHAVLPSFALADTQRPCSVVGSPCSTASEWQLLRLLVLRALAGVLYM
jgi:hypothetical protein